MILVVRALRLFLTVVYASYLVNVGLLLLILPWSEAWSHFVLLVPYRAAIILDIPAIRGAISAFGFLHLALLLFELVNPSVATHNR